MPRYRSRRHPFLGFGQAYGASYKNSFQPKKDIAESGLKRPKNNKKLKRKN